ncbi:hypothetical protein THAOC_21238 [Thalassiosira oceanica]|uniref:Uncharacterized protein n=1 Tax=Thalassiosira oceanica TaxID=159749 RepID=K0S005_THAOC|nr:hypothetical protein THAOC_21238 [Thalassiosira oceanica]|mmetsp:Transcript_38987/g.93379  ORF Transcript_38987/g.93379 Transcript_38987/m.93379 type:complete len:84 (+) Transcript_38987:312-563(+)|eukprot:EJK58625.1 hypothetical protein THAOC_21238 [Thalassiosira oceanica]
MTLYTFEAKESKFRESPRLAPRAVLIMPQWLAITTGNESQELKAITKSRRGPTCPARSTSPPPGLTFNERGIPDIKLVGYWWH